MTVDAEMEDEMRQLQSLARSESMPKKSLLPLAAFSAFGLVVDNAFMFARVQTGR
jgi:hypothetical protein